MIRKLGTKIVQQTNRFADINKQLSNFSIFYNINFDMQKVVNNSNSSRNGSRRNVQYINNERRDYNYYGSTFKRSTPVANEPGTIKNQSRPMYQSINKMTSSTKSNSTTFNNYQNYNIMSSGLSQNFNMSSSQNDKSRSGMAQNFRIKQGSKDALSNSRKTQKDEQEALYRREMEEIMALQKKRKEDYDKQRKEKQRQLYQREKQKQRQRQRQRQRERQREREREQKEKQKQRQKQLIRQRQKQREKQREREREREREKERERQKERQLQKERQRQKERERQRQRLKQYSKVTYSMTNSTSTGTSDYSTSTLRNGGTSYGYSTSSSKTIGLVGLNNIGNTCFMNSILQCMFNLPGFNDYFLTGKYQSQIKTSGRVAEAYAKTVKMIRNSSARSETPSQLKSAIGSKKSRFMGYAQQDAQQFLAALLQLISIDLNRSKNPKYTELSADTKKKNLKEISDDWWNYNKQREDSIVCDFFSGQVLSRVVCSKCSNQSIAFDNIWDMALDFTPNDKGQILRMVENFLKKQTIADDYYCSSCKALRQCDRKIDFYRLPKILVFQLKRFSYGKFRKVKLNNRVRVPATLNLSELVSESNHESVRNPIYNLVGIVNHSGDIDFGHYTAECRNPINGKWYDFNDSSVYQTKIRDEFESSSPYLLFFAKQGL